MDPSYTDSKTISLDTPKDQPKPLSQPTINSNQPSYLDIDISSTESLPLEERLSALAQSKRRLQDARADHIRSSDRINEQAIQAEHSAIFEFGNEIVALLKRHGKAYCGLQASSTDPPETAPFISKVMRTIRQSYPDDVGKESPAMTAMLLKSARAYCRNGDCDVLEIDTSLSYTEKEGYILEGKRRTMKGDHEEDDSAQFYLAPEEPSNSSNAMVDDDKARFYFLPQNILQIKYWDEWGNKFVEHIVLLLRGSMLNTIHLTVNECDTVEWLEAQIGVEAECMGEWESPENAEKWDGVIPEI